MEAVSKGWSLASLENQLHSTNRVEVFFLLQRDRLYSAWVPLATISS